LAFFDVEQVLDALENRTIPPTIDNEEIRRQIDAMQEQYGNCVRLVQRGVSPQGLPIHELIIESPTKEPKNHIVWNVDPHAADERIPAIASIEYAWMLLQSPRHLRGRSLHLVFTSPDDREPIDIGFASKAFAENPQLRARNNNVRYQSGWSFSHPSKPFGPESSAGIKALDKSLDVVAGHIRRKRRTNYAERLALFISGHCAGPGTGTYWHVGAPKKLKKRTGKALEAVATELGQGLTIPPDASHLAPIANLRAVFGPDTAKARRRIDPTMKIRASDGEYAEFHARRIPGNVLTTLITESPQDEVVLRPFLWNADNEVHGQHYESVKAARSGVADLLKQVGRLAQGVHIDAGSAPKSPTGNALRTMNRWMEALKSHAEPSVWGSTAVRPNAPVAGHPSNESLLEIEIIRSLWDYRELTTAAIAAMAMSSDLAVLAGNSWAKWGRLGRMLNAKAQEIYDTVNPLCYITSVSPKDHVAIQLLSVEAAFSASMGAAVRADRETGQLSFNR
jgi:hypothetical protein